MSNLTCHWSKQDNGIVLSLSGQLSLAETGKFDAEIEDILEQKPERLVVDMSGLSAIGSAGLGALLKLQLRGRQQKCEVRLTGLQPNIEEVIKAARLDSVFTIS